jgi:hypothetical protein
VASKSRWNNSRTRRKPYTDTRRWDHSCRNSGGRGSCERCHENRLYTYRKSNFQSLFWLVDYLIGEGSVRLPRRMFYIRR